jgi:anti-sigma factor RsiW
MKRQGVTESPAGRWTRAEDYLGAMARRRTYRRKSPRQRTEPESPRLLLSTIPFVALLALLAVLAVSIMIAAFPGTQPQQHAPVAAPREQGVAPRGWFQEAQKEFHR